MIGGKSGFLERDHGDAGVPDRRNAGLHSNGVAVFDFEPGEFLDFAPGQRIVRAVTERHEREDGIHHRGVNGGEAFGALEVIEHPGFCFAEGALAKRLPRELFVEFQAAVEREENIFPGEELLAPIEGGVLMGEILEQFIDAGALGQAPTGAQGAQDGHGNDDAARPGGHFVDVDKAPVRQEHQLDGNGRDELPANGADQREIKADVRIGVRGAAGVNAPAAVGQLSAANVVGELGDALRLGFTQNEEIVNVVGFEGGVGFELALPVAWFRLKRKQVIGAALDGLFQARRPVFFKKRHGRRRDGSFFSHSNRRGHERSPRAELQTGETSKARLAHRKCDATARSAALRGIWGDPVRLRITPVLLDYRRLSADGQRLRCRAATASCQRETPAGASKARWTRTWRGPGRGSPSRWITDGFSFSRRAGSLVQAGVAAGSASDAPRRTRAWARSSTARAESLKSSLAGSSTAM